jgi:hypothetical protein
MNKHQSKCAWCGKFISDTDEVFGLEATATPSYKEELKKKEGEVISLFLTFTGKVVDVIVVTEHSEAKKKGVDVIFMLCSKACALALKRALLQEKKALFRQIISLS